MANELTPISDTQAQEIADALEFGATPLETAKAVGGFIASFMGTRPEDLIGIVGRDWLRLQRANNISRTGHRALEELDRRGVEDREEVSLSIALPILEAAADESREELSDLWAKLMASAMDPARSRKIRREFVEAVKALEPADARIIATLSVPLPVYNEGATEQIARLVGISMAEAELSLLHLCDLGILYETGTSRREKVVSISRVDWTTFGRELRALVV